MGLYSEDGNRQQSSVEGAKMASKAYPMPFPMTTGIVTDVYCFDRQDSAGNPINLPGMYITYTVALVPGGVIIQNVPAMNQSGGHTQYRINAQGAPSLDNQNTEETPYVIGQPVIIGFLFNSSMNPIILGGAPCQLNASTSDAQPLDPQTGGNPFNPDPTTGISSGIFPQKQGIFQGTLWKIDKNGNPTVNLVTNGKMKVEVNGVPFITVDGQNNLVDIGTGVEFGVLGNTLQAYLNSLKLAYDTHIHSGVTTGAGVSGPPSTPSPSVPTVTTQVLKVQ